MFGVPGGHLRLHGQQRLSRPGGPPPVHETQEERAGRCPDVPKLPGFFLPADSQPFDAATVTKTPLVFAAAIQECCEPLACSPKTPHPVFYFLDFQIKTEATLDEEMTPFASDPLDDVSYCGVALGTPFPIHVCYFDRKQDGVQSRVIGGDTSLGELVPNANNATLPWEALESHGLRQRCVAVVCESPNAMLGGLDCCPQNTPEVSGLRELLEGIFIATD